MIKLYSSYREYCKEVVDKGLKEKLGYVNDMQLPKLTSIVAHIRLGRYSKDKNIMRDALRDLGLVTGQKPVPTLAKKSVASFKTRKGQMLGGKVTLRRHRMMNFLFYLRDVVCPRLRGFHGLKPKGDGRGSYTLCIEDHMVFPSVNPDQSRQSFRIDLSFVIAGAKNEEEGIVLLKAHGMPFMDKR